MGEGNLMEGEAFAMAGDVLAQGDPTENRVTQESIHQAGGVKTIVKKTIVNGVVVSSTRETIEEGGLDQGKGVFHQVEVIEEEVEDEIKMEEDPSDAAASSAEI